MCKKKGGALKSFTSGHMFLNAAWIFAGGLGSSLLTFIGSVFVARYLTVENYGILQLATTYFIFLSLLEQIIHPGVARIELIKSGDHTAAEYQKTIGQVTFFIFFFITSILVLCSFLLNSDFIMYVAIMCSAQIFRCINGISYFLDVSLRAKANSSASLIGNFFSTIYRIVMAIADPRIFWQSLAFTVSNSLAFLYLLAFHFDGKVRSLLRFNATLARELVLKSAPMFSVAILSLMVYKLDIILLGIFGSPEEIGFYSNAVKLTEPWNFAAWALINSMLPNIISERSKSMTAYFRKIRVLFGLLIGLALVIGVFGCLFADEIVSVTFGPEYSRTAELLKVHIWSNIFLFLMNGQQFFEINERLKGFALLKYSLGVISNLILNVILIPKLGGMGCAISSIVTYFLVAYGFNFLIKKGSFLNHLILSSVLELPKNLLLVSKMIWSRLS